MKRKIALKRLSSSDLTLFEHHYRNTTGAKQKGINLDRSVFIDQLFPTVPDLVGLGRIPLDLSVYGPGLAGLHNLQRKVKKEAKNWRLNGELIFNPPEEPSRYDLLAKNDYAILDFAGDPEPHAARMYLVARGVAQDMALYAALEAKYGASFSPRKGLLELDPDELAHLLGALGLPTGHPALDFIDFDALEDAAQGGLDGLTKLKRRRQARGVSREELGRARQSAEQVGRLGEEILNAWFESRYEAGTGPKYCWDSDANAVAPYDFSLMDEGTTKRRVDAKSTSGNFHNPLHVSLAELMEMAYGGLPYDLYRLYEVSDISGRLRVAENVGEFAANVLEKFRTLPPGITVDGISINPAVLAFGDETFIDLSVSDGNGDEEVFDD